MFEFYFQSGEFTSDDNGFLYDVLIQLVAWILAGITAYVVIRIQQAYHVSNQEKAKSDKEVDNLRYLTYLIESSSKYSATFIKGVKDFIATLKADPSEIGNVYLTGEDDLIRLTEKIEQEHYFHALRNQLGSDILGPVFYGFDTIKNLKEQMMSYMDKFKLEYDYNRKKQFADLVFSLSEVLNSFLLQNKTIKLVDKDKLEIYNGALLNYINIAQSDPNNLKRYKLEFIDPLREIVIKHISTGVFDEKSVIRFLDSSNKCNG